MRKVYETFPLCCIGAYFQYYYSKSMVAYS